MYNTILVPTDGTPLSDKAISAAVQFARARPDCKIIGLSVSEPLPLFQIEFLGKSNESGYANQAKKASEAKVARVAEFAKEGGIACETLVTESAKPHEEIIRVAAQYNCDCIFMASHGRKGLNKFFIGSETQKVLAMAEIPVLVYR